MLGLYTFSALRDLSGSGLQETRRQGLPTEHAVLLEYLRNRKSPRLALVTSCCCTMLTVDSAVLVSSWGQMSSRCWLAAPAGEPWHPGTWSGGDGSVLKERDMPARFHSGLPEKLARRRHDQEMESPHSMQRNMARVASFPYSLMPPEDRCRPPSSTDASGGSTTTPPRHSTLQMHSPESRSGRRPPRPCLPTKRRPLECVLTLHLMRRSICDGDAR